jgi:hypothetical protein
VPRTFSPGHRPDAPLYEEDVVYTTLDKVSDYLQLPLPDPVALAGNSVIDVGNIKFPITGADFRRWGYEATDKILVYDDADAIGKTYTITSTASVGSDGHIYLIAAKEGAESFTTANNAYIQHQSAFTNSKERGIKKSHVQNLIRIRQDYIDRVTRHAWRPRLVAEEYCNFTTFKPFRRRYYTDYVGAVFLKHGAVQRILKMGAWQGDYYREMAAARAAFTVADHTVLAGESVFLCPGANGVATLTEGNDAQTKWRAEFDHKSTAENLAALINHDSHFNKAAIPIGALTVESADSSNTSLKVHEEFLALGNSDAGDGVIEVSSMRSTEGGQNATIAFSQNTGLDYVGRLNTKISATVTGTTGTPVTSFTVDNGNPFVNGHSLVYIESGTSNRVALCSRVGNTFTVVTDLANDFDNNVVGATIHQVRFLCDIDDEERQKSWWSIEENGQILFNNEYPFFENHSLRMSYIYGERYVDKNIEDACTKLVVMDILMSDDYSVMFPEGTQNIDLNTKHQKLEAEVAKLLVPFQESIIVAGMGG